MLRVKNIFKNFGRIRALDGVSFKIDKNSVVGLLGPNGAGKTTLMRVLVGYLKADSGAIYWDGKKVDNKSIRHRKRIGYLPENNPLYGNMTCYEYLEYIAGLKDADINDLDKIVKTCGLKKVLIQKIENLSKGFKQRVGLAAAMIGNPKILILDEPTSGLDPNQIIEIRNLIKNIAKKSMVILSTHILPEAKAVCDQLLIINRGKIVLNQETKTIANLEKKFVELTK